MRRVCEKWLNSAKVWLIKQLAILIAVAGLAFTPTQYTYAPVAAQTSQAPIFWVNENQGTYDHPQLTPKPADPTLFNCYLYVKERFPSLPFMRNVISQATTTRGNVAVFLYKNGLYHFAVVEATSEASFSISETNFHAGKLTRRTISYSDPALLGFFSVSPK